MSPVAITAVDGRTATKAFIRLPYTVYSRDSPWVAPLELDQRSFLDPGRHPFFEFGQAQLFIASRGRAMVGRIAAIANPHYNALRGTHHGFFGMFECHDDPVAAHALLSAAEKWLRDRGLRTAIGPVSYSTNYECGLLVDGFAHPPTVMMPYHQPYYAALIEHSGYTKVKDLWSWQVPCTAELPPRVARVVDALKRRENLLVRPLDMRRWNDEIATVKEIYDDAWERNWGFVPMTGREFAHLAKGLRQVMVPGSALIAESAGVPVAFALGLPDANQALQPLRGRLTTFGLPAGLLRLRHRLPRVTRGRLLALGVRASHRYRGIHALLFAEMVKVANRHRITEWDISWTLEDNTAINRAVEAMGGVRYKTHRLYQKPLL